MQDPAQLDSLLRLDISLGDTNSMDTLLAELVNITLKVRGGVLPEEPLKDPEIALVVDFGT